MSDGKKTPTERAREIDRRLSQIGKDLTSTRTPSPDLPPMLVDEEEELVDALFRSVGSDPRRLRRIVEAIDRRLAIRRS